MLNFPQFFRNIYRIIVVAIIIGFTILILELNNMQPQEETLGTKTKLKSGGLNTNQYLIGAIEHKNNYQANGDKKEFDVARDLILSSLELDPENPYAIRLLQGLINQDIGQNKEEIQKILKTLEARPDYAAAWISLGILYEQIGEVNLSKMAKEKAKALNSDL